MRRRDLFKSAATGLSIVLLARRLAATPTGAAQEAEKPGGGMGTPLEKRGARTYENDRLKAVVSARGGLLSIINKQAEEAYSLTSDHFAILTDKGTFSSREAEIADSSRDERRWTFTFDAGPYKVDCIYTFGDGWGYLRRRLRIYALKGDLTVKEAVLGSSVFSTTPEELVEYQTFWHCPTTCFVRFNKGGLFTGIENPFFKVVRGAASVELSFAPSLVLSPGQEYDTEPQFIGTYRKSGATIADHYPNTMMGLSSPRFSNPCGHKPLDRNEIRAMRRFADEYLQINTDGFKLILYLYWDPIKPFPSSDRDLEGYFRMIDVFAEIGGDLIIFNPLERNVPPPDKERGRWDLAPPGSPAAKIHEYAKSKGISIGYYSGVAVGEGFKNVATIGYRPDKPEWKKVDFTGRRGRENSMACDDYARWFFDVQRNTIKEYGLRMWAWDPGPGNGFFSYAANHGHLPGAGDYKGWRNSTKLIGDLKREFPDLYLQEFYGRKEYGLWGHKCYDQHEGMWEQQPNCWATLHPDFHPDRLVADGIRLQAIWAENFRFRPSTQSHTLAGRMHQNWASGEPELCKLYDHLGWKYAVMSALAIGGSVTMPILPESADIVSGGDYAQFFRKWMAWARKHYGYVKYSVSFGGQVRPGAVDGHARIKDDHGFVFLCNPNPRPCRITFELGDEIGLYAKGSFLLKEIYPQGGAFFFDAANRRGVFRPGDKVTADVPPYTVHLFELEKKTTDAPVLFGVPGEIAVSAGSIKVKNAASGAGTAREVAVFTGNDRAYREVEINGRRFEARTEDGYVFCGPVRFGSYAEARMLDQWVAQDGKRFPFPYHDKVGHMEIATRFTLDADVKRILDAWRPKNLNEILPILANPRWKDLHNGNLAWARPDRLHLVVPYKDRELEGLRVRVNGREAPMSLDRLGETAIASFADITDCVEFGRENGITMEFEMTRENQFLGPYLEYPPAPPTPLVSPAGPAPPAVIYDRPLDPDTLGRGARAGKGAPPRVLSLTMTPDFLEEGGTTTFWVKTDAPPREIEAVFLSCPSHLRDWRCEYDQESELWRADIGFGARYGTILDANKACAWVVTTDGRVSDAFSAPIRWKLPE